MEPTNPTEIVICEVFAQILNLNHEAKREGNSDERDNSRCNFGEYR